MSGHPVTAIDIALKPDAAMVRRAQAANARLLKAYPEGFQLDATHHPHMTMIQRFVRTADLAKVHAAADAVFAKEEVANWRLKAIRYYYIPAPPLGIAGIVVEPTEDLLRLQHELLDAVAPFTEKTGTPAAFFTDDGRDEPGLMRSSSTATAWRRESIGARFGCTRSGLDWTAKYPATAAALAELKVKSAYIDGELCGVRPDGVTSFEIMQQAADGGGGALVYYAFDLIELDGVGGAARASKLGVRLGDEDQNQKN